MKVLVVLAHPNKLSFNHAIARTAAATLVNNGHDVVLHDLYEEKFDALLPTSEILKDSEIPPSIAQYCAQLSDADGIIVVHPNWWGQPPAIMKGWVDRVFRPGIAYEFEEGDKGEGSPIGLLRARSAIVINTSNTPEERELAIFGDPLAAIWERCIFDLCGIKNIHRTMFRVLVTSTPEKRHNWLEEVQQTVAKHYPPEAN